MSVASTGTGHQAGSRPDLGRIGVWAVQFRMDQDRAVQSAAELEQLGYGALWVPGGRGGDLLDRLSLLLDATAHVTVATGILNIWMHEPSEVGSWWRALPSDHQRRVLLGLGVGHAPVIGDAWKKPLEKMSIYLDALDEQGVPAANRCVAALGPKMLDLSRDRTAGAHPYLVPPEHTAHARERLGPDALLAVEQGVILDTDADSARAKAREQLETYANLPNYRNSWKRLGFTEEEIAGRADRLVDALFAWGTPDRLQERIEAHLAAGADHVCLQVVAGAPGAKDMQLRESWRALAPATR